MQIDETTLYSAQRYLLSTTRWHSGRLDKQFLRYDKMFKTLFLQIEETTVYSAALDNALTLRQFLRYDKMFKTLFLQIEKTTVYSAQRYLLSTTR